MVYIRENNNLGLKYYSKKEDAPLSDILRQASINTDKQLMVFSDSSWQYCPDTCISPGTYIVFMFQVQLQNILLKVSIMQHSMQEWI